MTQPLRPLRPPVPTVYEVIDSLVYCYKQAGVKTYFWRCPGGALLKVPEDDLLPALQAAYDPTMPNWPSLVEIDA
jgi:hypothetical protein